MADPVRSQASRLRNIEASPASSRARIASPTTGSPDIQPSPETGSASSADRRSNKGDAAQIAALSCSASLASR